MNIRRILADVLGIIAIILIVVTLMFMFAASI